MYILVSLMFVVATIFELTVLVILKKKSEEKIGIIENNSRIAERNIKFQGWIQKIDKICIIIFPVLFFMFNVIYFVIMMH